MMYLHSYTFITRNFSDNSKTLNDNSANAGLACTVGDVSTTPEIVALEVTVE